MRALVSEATLVSFRRVQLKAKRRYGELLGEANRGSQTLIVMRFPTIRVAERLPAVSDIETLDEWRAQARALEGYLRDREMQGPVLGIQRRAEARIGELLGEAKVGAHHSVVTEGAALDKHDRADFRVLSRALNGCPLTDDEWRKSRRALVSLIRNRTGDVPATSPPSLSR